MPAWVLACLVAPGVASGVWAADEARVQAAQHTATCVAALRLRADEVAAQVRAGRAELKPLLYTDLQRGAAFIGRSYLAGQRDEDAAKARLDDALAVQRARPKAELQLTQDACTREADSLLAGANFAEKLVLNKLAERRLEKMLAAKP